MPPPPPAPAVLIISCQHASKRANKQESHARAPQVHLFGSVANGLSIRNNNDLDVCLALPGEALDSAAAKGEVVERLGQVLGESGMR
jgi:hypothetical protein